MLHLFTLTLFFHFKELPSSSGNQGTCNINFLNIDLLKGFEILEESKKSPSQLPPLDMNKIVARTNRNLERRHKQSERIGVGVSSVAQNLFDIVSKT